MIDLSSPRGALFSDDRLYRYLLWRTWNPDKPKRLWIMLNPSTADEESNDPTVERCERRTLEDDYGGVVVCNIFAWRDTDPKSMRRTGDPVGQLNDATIIETATKVHDEGGQIVLAYGIHGGFKGRGPRVIAMLLTKSLPLHVLALTKEGHPKHPLYISYATKPTPIYSA